MIWESLQGGWECLGVFGKVWASLDCFGRVWDLGAFGRVGGPGRVWEALGGFGRVWVWQGLG